MSNDSEKIPLRNFAADMLAGCLEGYGLPQKALATAIHMPRSGINDLLGERRDISPDMALRIGPAMV